MTISPVIAELLQVGQGGLGLVRPPSERLSPKSSPASFEQALAVQMPDQMKLSSAGVSGVQPTEGKGLFTQVIGDTQKLQARAAHEVNGLVRGDGTSLHNAMIAMEEASISFQLLVEMRNKVVESFQELMRMQI